MTPRTAPEFRGKSANGFPNGSPGPESPPILGDPLTELGLIVAASIPSEASMIRLHHRPICPHSCFHPFCPRSRFVRLALAGMSLSNPR